MFSGNLDIPSPTVPSISLYTSGTAIPLSPSVLNSKIIGSSHLA